MKTSFYQLLHKLYQIEFDILADEALSEARRDQFISKRNYERRKSEISSHWKRLSLI